MHLCCETAASIQTRAHCTEIRLYTECAKCKFNKASLTAMVTAPRVRAEVRFARRSPEAENWSNPIWHHLIWREEQWRKRQRSIRQWAELLLQASGYICSQLKSSALNTSGNEKPKQSTKIKVHVMSLTLSAGIWWCLHETKLIIYIPL